jgi:hypothetical protein
MIGGSCSSAAAESSSRRGICMQQPKQCFHGGHSPSENVPGASATTPGALAAAAVVSFTAIGRPELLLCAPCTTTNCCWVLLLSLAAADASDGTNCSKQAEDTSILTVPDAGCICCCCDPSDHSKGHTGLCPRTGHSWSRSSIEETRTTIGKVLTALRTAHGSACRSGATCIRHCNSAMQT